MVSSSECFDLRFDHPATHYMSGPSTSGKTYRTAQILRHKDVLIKNGEQIKNVVFCYAQWQDEYVKLKQEGIVTKWCNLMPSVDQFVELVQDFRREGGSIVVIDDFMSKIGPDLDEIVRVTARHQNASVFLLFQSLFPPHKLARQISLNMKYLHIHKNPRENEQIYTLARQLKPHNSAWMVEVFFDATHKKFSCLLFDLTQGCPEHLRVRSNYLPAELPMKVWAAKGSLVHSRK